MSDNKPFIDVRAVFKKKGAAIYFSHLDLMRTMSRVLRRSKLDIWLSEGFTPRPHIVFSPPLSLGSESEGEIMDFRLKLGASLDKEAFKNAFPKALEIEDVYFPETKLKEIAYARYRIAFETDATPRDVAELFSKPLVMTKKTKRSEQEMDITQFIHKFECTQSGGRIIIDTVLDLSQEATLSPSYLIGGMNQRGIETKKVRISRLEFLTKDMTKFR